MCQVLTASIRISPFRWDNSFAKPVLPVSEVQMLILFRLIYIIRQVGVRGYWSVFPAFPSGIRSSMSKRPGRRRLPTLQYLKAFIPIVNAGKFDRTPI
jgi:hypothetical protein